MKRPNIPDSVIRRLPVYLRHLEQLLFRNVRTISSALLAEELDTNAAQIRKDLSYFGDFGRKGIGYDVRYLSAKIRDILNLNEPLPVALVGAGRLGIALCHYNKNVRNNVKIVAVFDSDKEKWGSDAGGNPVLSDSLLQSTVADLNVKAAIITVPREVAQQVADTLVNAGVLAILNFAPIPLRVPDNVRVRNTDFTSELQSLAFYTASEMRFDMLDYP